MLKIDSCIDYCSWRKSYWKLADLKVSLKPSCCCCNWGVLTAPPSTTNLRQGRTAGGILGIAQPYFVKNHSREMNQSQFSRSSLRHRWGGDFCWTPVKHGHHLFSINMKHVSQLSGIQKINMLECKPPKNVVFQWKGHCFEAKQKPKARPHQQLTVEVWLQVNYIHTYPEKCPVDSLSREGKVQLGFFKNGQDVKWEYFFFVLFIFEDPGSPLSSFKSANPFTAFVFDGTTGSNTA